MTRRHRRAAPGRRTIVSIALGCALIMPAGILGVRDHLPAEADRALPVRIAGQPQAAEQARLYALFAQHYSIPIDLAGRIHRLAREENVDPVVAFGLVRTESGFRRTAVSFRGAVGYTQLMPATARWMEPGLARRDLFHTDVNLRVGFRYLRYLLDRYDGDLRLALTAYNRGPGTVDRLLTAGRDPENGYADKVLGTDEEGRLPGPRLPTS